MESIVPDFGAMILMENGNLCYTQSTPFSGYGKILLQFLVNGSSQQVAQYFRYADDYPVMFHKNGYTAQPTRPCHIG
jgi:hypothetical protein